MTYVLAIFTMILVVFTFFMMYIRRNTLWLGMSIIGTFSIGYYVLPIFNRKWANLDKVFDDELIFVQFIAFLFFGFFILGVYITEKAFSNHRTKTINMNTLNMIFMKYHKIIYSISFIIWLLYYFTTDITSYSAEDFEAYFTNKTWYNGPLDVLSNFATSSMALILAYKMKKNINYIWYLVPYLVIISLLLVSGQRLTVIQPVFMLICGLFLFGSIKKAINLSVAGVVFLVLISPLMVFFREYQGTRGKGQAIEAASNYKSGNSTIEKSLQSIIERADLLYVSTVLVRKYDNGDDFNHQTYLTSVATSFIPRILYKDKPYALSDDGTMNREISVQAWKTIMGNTTGSLSAFGSISAYREGGLVWVLINGFLAGCLSALLYFLFARGGVISKVLYVSIFIQITIKHVPISFFYLVVALVPLVYTTLFLKILDFLITSLFFRNIRNEKRIHKSIANQKVFNP